jgi:TonB family protein
MLNRLLVFVLFAGSAFGQSTVDTPLSGAAHYPKLTHAELPLYPAIAWTAHITGTVKIEVTVDKGSVVDAQIKSDGSPYLSNPSLANVKTWQFQPEGHTTFSVTYVYKIAGEQTLLPENPRVELDLPRLVTVTARPFKPSCSDCVPDATTGTTH